MDQNEQVREITQDVEHEIRQAALRLVPYAIGLAAIALLAWWVFRPSHLEPDKQLRGVASVAESLLLTSVFAGVAAMATVQFWKALFHPRSDFHAAELNRIFHGAEEQVLGMAAPNIPEMPTYPQANENPWNRAELPDINLEAKKLKKLDKQSLRILLDSPTEVLMGQIRTAADYIVLRPEGFERALEYLAGPAGKEAVNLYLRNPVTEDEDSVAAVRFFVEQNLNRIHITLRDGWRRQVRTVAALVAGAAGFLTITFADLGLQAKGTVVLVAVVWGGFFSWLARDVAALVERRRG